MGRGLTRFARPHLLCLVSSPSHGVTLFYFSVPSSVRVYLPGATPFEHIDSPVFAPFSLLHDKSIAHEQ